MFREPKLRCIVQLRVPLKTLPVVLLALGAACVTQDGPFTAVGRPDKPLHEARPHCKERTRSSDGAINWGAYEICMADLGWVKQPAGGVAEPGSVRGGGGGPSY